MKKTSAFVKTRMNPTETMAYGKLLPDVNTHSCTMIIAESLSLVCCKNLTQAAPNKKPATMRGSISNSQSTFRSMRQVITKIPRSTIGSASAERGN